MVGSRLVHWFCPYFLSTANSGSNVAFTKTYTLHLQFYKCSLIHVQSSFNAHFPFCETAIPVLESALLFPTVYLHFFVPEWSIDVPSKRRAMKAKPFCLMQDFPAKVQRTGLAQLLMKAKAEVTARLDLEMWSNLQISKTKPAFICFKNIFSDSKNEKLIASLRAFNHSYAKWLLRDII